MTGRRSARGQIQMPPPYAYSSSPLFSFTSFPLYFLSSFLLSACHFFLLVLFACSLSCFSSSSAFIFSSSSCFIFCSNTHTHTAVTQNVTLSSNGQKMRLTFNLFVPSLLILSVPSLYSILPSFHLSSPTCIFLSFFLSLSCFSLYQPYTNPADSISSLLFLLFCLPLLPLFLMGFLFIYVCVLSLILSHCACYEVFY